MSQTSKQKVGTWGERLAAAFLSSRGYKIEAINFKTRVGEIDIIARDYKPHFGETLCFVEVKTRKILDGSAERAVGKEKMAHLFKAAKSYCVEKEIDTNKTPIQFEQISIYGNEIENRVFHYVIPVD